MMCDWCNLEITGIQSSAYLSTERPQEYTRSLIATMGRSFSETLRMLSDPPKTVMQYHFHDTCAKDLDSIIRERKI